MMNPNDNPRHIEECWNVTIIVNLSWQCLNTFFLFQLLLNNALNFTEYRSYLNGQFLFVIQILSEQVVKFAICCKICNLQVVLVKLVV